MTKDENIQKEQELEVSEKIVFEAYRKRIDEGHLQVFAAMDSDMINEELECICNAVLLSRNTEAALNLIINLAGRKDRLTPENWAVLNHTSERLKSLAEKGGWLPVQNTETEQDIENHFPKDVYPEQIEKYLNSDNPWEIRYGIITMFEYKEDKKYLDDILVRLKNINYDHYYVKMAKAWLISIMYIKYPKYTFKELDNLNLDSWTIINQFKR